MKTYNAIVEEIRKEIANGVSSWRDRELIKHIDTVVEELSRERADLEQKLTNCRVLAEDLTLEKEALIEVLEEVSAAPVPNYYTEYHPLVKLVRAARTILSRMKG